VHLQRRSLLYRATIALCSQETGCARRRVGVANMSSLQTSPTLPLAVQPRQRIASVQVFRGLAALMVALSHLGGVELAYLHTHYLDANKK
jgi:hypothetical protein